MAFIYKLGEITDGEGNPVPGIAYIEIVDATNPQILLGEISVEIDDAQEHARRIVAALSAKPL